MCAFQPAPLPTPPSFFSDTPVSEVSCLVKELPQGLVALPLVADFGRGDAAGAGADVGRAVLLARVVQVAGLGGVQAVVLSGHRRLTCRQDRGRESARGEKLARHHYDVNDVNDGSILRSTAHPGKIVTVMLSCPICHMFTLRAHFLHLSARILEACRMYRT